MYVCVHSIYFKSKLIYLVKSFSLIWKKFFFFTPIIFSVVFIYLFFVINLLDTHKTTVGGEWVSQSQKEKVSWVYSHLSLKKFFFWIGGMMGVNFIGHNLFVTVRMNCSNMLLLFILLNITFVYCSNWVLFFLIWVISLAGIN